MPMFGKIRRMCFRDKLSVCEIARRTGLSCNAIKQAAGGDGGLKTEWGAGAGGGRTADAVQGPALAAACRPAATARSGTGGCTSVLFASSREPGFGGSYSTAHRLHPALARGRAFVVQGPRGRLGCGLGRGLPAGLEHRDEPRRRRRTPPSGRPHQARRQPANPCWCAGDPAQGQRMLFDAHTRAFQHQRGSICATCCPGCMGPPRRTSWRPPSSWLRGP